MRALRVLELAANGLDVICEDPESDERFSLRYDEKLRAVARGDLAPSGRLTSEGAISPRDIQARIRSGATVEEIAADAGTSVTRVERFAYPVLLERETMSQRARRARPAIDGIAAGASVEETVAATLAGRGYTGRLTWDAFKAEDAWVLSLRWQVGRSENRAHWTFHPGPDHGTLTARDEAAAEVVDPALRVLRPLREVKAHERPVERPADKLAEQTVTDDRTGVLPPVRTDVARTGTESAAPAKPSATAAPAAPSPAARASARRGNRPAMPSWEDVLLGTRKG